MGSAAIEKFIHDRELLYVGFDGDGMWWAVGKQGSYGGAKTRPAAIQIALDASATGGRRKIVVLTKRGRHDYVISVVAQQGNRPSSQFFQDSVP